MGGDGGCGEIVSTPRGSVVATHDEGADRHEGNWTMPEMLTAFALCHQPSRQRRSGTNDALPLPVVTLNIQGAVKSCRRADTSSGSARPAFRRVVRVRGEPDARDPAFGSRGRREANRRTKGGISIAGEAPPVADERSPLFAAVALTAPGDLRRDQEHPRPFFQCAVASTTASSLSIRLCL